MLVSPCFRPGLGLVLAGFGPQSLVPALSVLWGRLGETAVIESPSQNGDTIVPVSAALTLMCFS